MKKLFFALITSFLFVATSWGQCTETIFASYQMASIGGSTDTYEYNFIAGRRVKELTLYLQRNSWAGVGPFKIYELGTGSKIYDKRPTDSNSGDYITLTISENATGIKFSNEMSCKANLWDVKITYRPYIEIPKNTIDFGSLKEGGYTSQGSISIAHSALNENITASTGTNFFTIADNLVINSGTCGPTTLNITFKPQGLGAYSDVITFSNGETVSLYGECSKNMEETNILEVKRISYASVRLGWKPIDGATGYRIVNTTTGISYFAEAEDTDYNVTGLKMGNTYKFVVHAMYNGATSLNHSNEVEATTKVKPGVVLEECVAYSSSGTKSMVMGVNGEINYDIKSNNNLYNSSTYKVKFTAWKNWWGVTGYPDLYMLVKLDGKDYFESTKYWKAADAGITSDPQEFEAMIPNNTVAIKFASGVANGTLDRYIENFTVYKEPVLSSDVNTLDFGEVELGESKTMKFNLTYMNATKLEATEDSRFFEITKINYTASCTQGTQEVEITFTPTDCKTDYTASLSIFNGQELAITLKGTIKKSGSEENTIIWNGTASTEWDNRDNWIKEDGSPLLCTDKLSKDLTVILPAPNSTKYKVPEGGITQYPIIPDVSTEDKFFKDRNNTWFGNQVNAGDNATATKVADKIIMEYGASLVGVETLNAGGVSRYNEAEVKFEARRTEWLLVGAIVNPFEDGSTTVTREARSGDYYLNYLPHVYMHQAKLDANGKVGWDETFSDMYKPLNNDVVFALRLPNQYGPSRLPSTVYNRRNGTSYNGTQPCLYTFNGRFANESALPTYNVTPTQSVLLTNTYPANINAYKLQNGKGTILYYDYNQESFVPVGDNKNAEINAQHGFVFTPSEGVTSLSITKDDFNNTETGHRSAEQEVQSLRLRVANEIKSVSSEIYVRLDEAKDDEANYSVDAPKIFNTKALALPDVYAIRYDKKWSCLYVPTMSESVALGINVATAGQTFKFSLAENSMPFDVILEDRQTGIKYNLSNGEEFEVSDLEVGACEGRFYLAAEQKTEDDDVTTTIEENLFGENIDIFTQASQVVITSNSNILIKKVIISDLSGRTQVYESTDSEFYNNHYIKIDMPVSAGIYTINVISDSVVKTEKIRLN
ncbi:MAG: fibronectin type III domain-containing protein [Paludibacteraceae bacterium]|nr:fibronectin type III domain-containing protein [Paludibacteraceae bacterium]MBR6686546.1 fibronectin type III domain-containing protein [Paludibacteraceae bacterium]